MESQFPTSRSRRSNAQMTAGAIGSMSVVLGAGLGILLPRFFKLFKRNKASRGRPQKEQPGEQVATVSFSTQAAAQTLSRTSPPYVFGSPVDPGTPVFNKHQASQGRDHEDKSSKDAISRDQQLANALTPQDMATVKQLLVQVQQMQEENAKLREFTQVHLSTSNKVRELELENQRLKEMQGRLQEELQEARARPTFALSSGQELERFKTLLLDARTARSVCSDAGGGIRDNVSVDGAATVADAFGSTKRVDGLLKQAWSMFSMSATSRPAGQTDGSHTPRQVAPPRPPPVPTKPNTPRRTTDSSVDVSALLENFGGPRF